MHEPALGKGQSRSLQVKIPVTCDEREIFRHLARVKCETLSVLVRSLLWEQIRAHNAAVVKLTTLNRVRASWEQSTTNGDFTTWLREELTTAERECAAAELLRLPPTQKGRRR